MIVQKKAGHEALPLVYYVYVVVSRAIYLPVRASE
jgi:hypothetical protein